MLLSHVTILYFPNRPRQHMSYPIFYPISKWWCRKCLYHSHLIKKEGAERGKRKSSSYRRFFAGRSSHHRLPEEKNSISWWIFFPNNLAACKIFQCYFNILHPDNDTEPVFREKPLVLYRHDRNLKDTPVCSRLLVNKHFP